MKTSASVSWISCCFLWAVSMWSFQGFVVVVEAQPASVMFPDLQEVENRACGDNVPSYVTIVNDSQQNIDIFWIHPRTGELQKLTSDPVKPKTSTPFNTHVDQKLEIHELPDEETGDCGGGSKTCRRALIEVKEAGKEKNVFKLTRDFEIERETQDLLIKAALGEQIPSNFELNNLSGSDIDTYWVSEMEAGKLVFLANVKNDNNFGFNSFVANEFEIHEKNCGDSCRTVNFKNPGTGQNVIITSAFSAIAGDDNISM